MQKLDFAEAVDLIVARDPRYDREAYSFLRDALDYTVKQRKKSRDVTGTGHVSGQQLLEGIRLYALKQFGPMVVTVFNYWGVRRCEDFGEMVYNLIRTGVFGKTDSDSIEDFKGCYTFEDAFITPFQPQLPVVHRRPAAIADTAAEQLN
ncbi:Minf_1886 family protein [Verrucomicrobiota bacterium sgz303538]